MNTVDEILSLLASEQRRNALYYLRQCDGPVPVADVAAAVADEIADRDTEERELHERLRVELRHVHLPKATQLDCVRYDPGLEMVEFGTPSQLLTDVLDTLEALDQSPAQSGTVTQ